jgi:hypothetical protein
MEIPAYKQNLYQEFLSPKGGIIMPPKKKQIRVMGLVPIMFDKQQLNQEFLS